METLVVVAIVLSVAVLVLQVLLLTRKQRPDLSALEQPLALLKELQERTERGLKDEICRNRDETSTASRAAREEQGTALKAVGDSLNRQLDTLVKSNEAKFYQFQQTAIQNSKELREQTAATLTSFNNALVNALQQTGENQKANLGLFSGQLEKLTLALDQRFEALRTSVETRLKTIQEDNAKQLEQMRLTVDEKLQGTLEKRLGDSFKLVTERLELVHKGLGEMQSLATGVGDLKKVLTNVKSRGTWGEVQLGAMLEQVLTPEQYGKDVAPTGTGEVVEYAVKLPGRGTDRDEVVWLPIDAKFPVEDYTRLVDAQERADAAAVEEALKALEQSIRNSAKAICQKYLSPPLTTDFGIMYLPTEGLFAEVLRRAGLVDRIQRECRVIVAGPTTLWALLNSLQMGFKTLAIEKRSSEVWRLLAAVKTEWSKYADIHDKIQKKLQEASNVVSEVQKKTRTIGRKLKDVQELPQAESQGMLPLSEPEDIAPEDAPGGECVEEKI